MSNDQHLEYKARDDLISYQHLQYFSISPCTYFSESWYFVPLLALLPQLQTNNHIRRWVHLCIVKCTQIRSLHGQEWEYMPWIQYSSNASSPRLITKVTTDFKKALTHPWSYDSCNVTIPVVSWSHFGCLATSLHLQPVAASLWSRDHYLSSFYYFLILFWLI